MRFALVNNKRSEAEPGLKGICPGCMQPVIAKCGNQKNHHWAHKSNNSCDNWWESETEWHRAWKNHFSKDWQEVFLSDEETGEKHIADIYTAQGLVIEFQHSNIKHEERISREKFYKNMIWVVDGSNSRNDFAYSRFVKNKPSSSILNKAGFYWCFNPEKQFPKNWLNSHVPVVFDFLGLNQAVGNKDPQKPLYYLYPQKIRERNVFAAISRKNFIELSTKGRLLNTMNKHLEELNKKEIEHRCELLTIEEAYEEAQDAIKRGDPYLAKHLFEKALELDTNPNISIDLKRSIAKAYKILEYNDRAYKFYTEILEEKPDDLYSKIALASVLKQQKEYPRSIALYESILKIEPNNKYARKGLASARREYEASKEIP